VKRTGSPLSHASGGRSQRPQASHVSPTLEDTVARTFLAPGASLKVKGLDVGTHLFECCIHPWMRAAIKVEED